jgi:hypothetical protein
VASVAPDDVELTEIAPRYVDRADRSNIPCTPRWTGSLAEATAVAPPQA